MIKNPFHPISPVMKLDGSELLCLKAPILIDVCTLPGIYRCGFLFMAYIIAPEFTLHTRPKPCTQMI
jgi:hypothetical protein